MGDVLPALDADARLGLHWVVNEGSQFADQLHRRLGELEVRLLTWEEACRRRFDLIVAAHSDGALGELDGPVATMAHGTGYNRKVLWRTGDPDAPVGISTNELRRDGRSVAAAIGLSCEHQMEQLFRSDPESVPLAFQMGDPTWDRMLANQGNAAAFRRELGIAPDQTLVGVSSTWGPHSAFGRDSLLVERILACLPRDEYRVVLVLHPNIWTYHGGYSVRGVLGDAIESGLVTVLPTSDWPAVLIAVDVFIGDHGSVSVYAAALGRPFLLTGVGENELVKGSTTLEFVRQATKLDHTLDLRTQLQAAATDANVVRAARLAMDNTGKSLQLLQAKFYELLGLGLPVRIPHPRRYRPLRLERDDIGLTAAHCRTTLTVQDDCEVTVVVERFPAVLADRRADPTDEAEYVLVVDERETAQVLKENAEVRLCTVDKTETVAWDWIDRVVRESPCFLAASVCGPDIFLGTRAGGRWCARAAAAIEPGVVAAAVYRLLVEEGCALTTPAIHLGERRVPVRVSRPASHLADP